MHEGRKGKPGATGTTQITRGSMDSLSLKLGV